MKDWETCPDEVWLKMYVNWMQWWFFIGLFYYKKCEGNVNGVREIYISLICNCLMSLFWGSCFGYAGDVPVYRKYTLGQQIVPNRFEKEFFYTSVCNFLWIWYCLND